LCYFNFFFSSFLFLPGLVPLIQSLTLIQFNFVAGRLNNTT
jgi:hypothetical protein